jgi:hypothetical protein
MLLSNTNRFQFIMGVHKVLNSRKLLLPRNQSKVFDVSEPQNLLE